MLLKTQTPLHFHALLEIMHVLVEDTNRYFRQYLGILDEGPCPLPEVTI